VINGRVRRLCAQFLKLSLLGAFAIGVLSACSRFPSQAELDSHFAKGGGPDWLFVPGGHLNFDGTTADVIRKWLIAHDTDWEPAHLSDFGHGKPQLLTGDSAVEIDSDRIRVSFSRDEKDSDSTIYIQRRLSPNERSFWDAVIEQIKTPVHAIHPREPAA
jgi:hypothetical protein